MAQIHLKFSDYLDENKIRRSAAAEALGCNPSQITRLCLPGAWMTREMARKIEAWTGGQVTVSSFLFDTLEERQNYEREYGSENHTSQKAS